MKRILSFEKGLVDLLNPKKYVYDCGDDEAALYQEKCPTGYLVSQSWLLVLDNNYLVCESYNNKCKEEMLDLIDEFNEKGYITIKGFKRENMLPYMHPSGYNFYIQRIK